MARSCRSSFSLERASGRTELPYSIVKNQLYFDLTAQGPRPSAYFREASEVALAIRELAIENCAVFEIDGAAIHSLEDFFNTIAIALRKPQGWYGDEEYASNANAFLEYLDDVALWVPAEVQVFLIRDARVLWRHSSKIAGDVVELWQLATCRGAKIRLIFVW